MVRLIVVGLLLSLVTVACAKAPKLAIPAGEHPRLCFRAADVPVMRERAATPAGGRLLQALRADGFGNRDALLAAVRANDEQKLAEVRNQLKTKSPRSWALLALLTQDSRDTEAAVAVFRLWLQNPELRTNTGWGAPEQAMAYDWLYGALTAKERAQADAVFGAMVGKEALAMFDREWWLDGPHPNGRSSGNWTPICTAGLNFCNMVVEGTKYYNPTLYDRCVTLTRAFLLDGIARDGAMTEGVQYPQGYGTFHTPLHLLALRQRGVDLIRTTHLSAAPLWFTYEMLPWGSEAQAINKSDGNYFVSTFTPFLANEFGGLADWVYLHGRGWGEIGDPDPVLALIHGLPEPGATRPDGLPRGHWFSTIGRVISRGGWGAKDAHFTVTTNVIGAGHSHGDDGAFTFAAYGVNFFCDSSVSQYNSTDHNLVHIDGIGVSASEAAHESFVRYAEFSDYADVADLDLTTGYDRVLSSVSPSGPWRWDDYNPVQAADRRTLFIRGLTGPIAVIADDLRKDEKIHEYDWVARTVANNRITVAGDGRFTIEERFGGRFLQSIDSGQQTALVATGVPAGQYRGWLLVRGVPYPRRWSNTTVALNGKRLPYNTTYFGLGTFSAGWSWTPILPKGPKTDPAIDLSAGELRLDLEGATGGQVALAVFTRDAGWTPGFDIPSTGGDFVVLDAATARPGALPWGVEDDPRATLQGAFLGEAPALRVGASRATGLPELHATLQADRGRFLVVLAPHEDTAPRALERPADAGARGAVLRSAAGADVIAGSPDGVPTAGALVTDGVAACVSLPDPADAARIRGYAVVAGRALAYRGRPLVTGTAPATVINDGTRLVVRGPAGASLLCDTLGATRLVRNGVETAVAAGAPRQLRVTLPGLAPSWQVRVSEDGRYVAITGDGPLPLKVRAPQAVDITVNGVSRYFVRDPDGYAWPQLQHGTELYRYAYELKGDALARAVAADTPATPGALPRSRAAALGFPGVARFDLPTVGPGAYRLTIGYAAADKGALTATLGGATVTLAAPTPDGDLRRERSEQFILRAGGAARLEIRSAKPFFITDLRLAPELQPLPADRWRTIGPFPSPWGPARINENVKKALETAFPPEKEIRLDASYPGAGGKDVSWLHTTDTGGPGMATGVNFAVTNGVTKDDLCYAVTFITSPDDREAMLRVGCDYWARAYLNGVLLESERPAALVAQDGAIYNTPNLVATPLRLRTGVNVLLLKVQSGSGGSNFNAFITNPGDLTIAPQP